MLGGWGLGNGLEMITWTCSSVSRGAGPSTHPSWFHIPGGQAKVQENPPAADCLHWATWAAGWKNLAEKNYQIIQMMR